MPIQILPLAADQKLHWHPLWRGYQAFYKADIPEAVSDVTWARLLDPAEPMGGAVRGKMERHSASSITSCTAHVGRRAIIAISKISLWLTKPEAMASVVS